MSKPFGLLACLLLVLIPAIARSAPDQQWIAVSDVHFDPLADPRLAERLGSTPPERWRAIFTSAGKVPYSAYGSDTNFPLLESALEAMRNADGDPAAVLITGGLLSERLHDRFDVEFHTHDRKRYARFVDATMRFLAIEFREAFPRARIIPTLGDADNACGNAETQPHSAFLARTAASWGASIGVPDPQKFIDDFSTGGYYAAPLPAGAATAVVVNTVFWANGYHNACGTETSDPGRDEMTWLSKTLQQLNGKRVWIIMHIPPGIDAQASLRANPPSAVAFLAQKYADPLVNALMAPGPIVQMTLAGRTHMNAFRVLGPDPSRPRIPLLLLPAVTPIEANNPTFTLLRVNSDTASVEDAQYFILDDLMAPVKNGAHPATWRREFAFDSVYGRGTLDASHLQSVQASIFDDERVRRRYETYYDGSSGRAPITEATWRFFWCADVALTPTLYEACASPQIQHQLPPHPPAPPLPTPGPATTP